jgi:hypothetical protein
MIPCPSCAAPFRFETKLGPGVYQATCCARVVVKVRSLAETGSWESHERFESAARWLARASHPGFPRVLAFEPMVERSAAFLVLERLDETLHARVMRGAPPLEGPEIRALLRGLLEAIACLHREGFVHGEVSPHTVMFRGEQPVLTGCGSFARHGDASEDVCAIARTVLFARRARLPSELRALFHAMLARDPRERPNNAADALRMLDGAPLPRAWRARLLGAAAPSLVGALAITLLGAVEWKHVRPPVAQAVGPNACRILSDPPAAVFLGDREVAWTAEHPLDRSLGATPLVVDRDPTHPLIVYARGHRPFVLEMTAKGPGPEAPCEFLVKLAAE